MTLATRLRRLEAMLPAQAEADAEAEAVWLRNCPDAMLSYAFSLASELQADTGDRDDGAAAERLLAAHPLFDGLRQKLKIAATVGEEVSLRRLQAHLLYLAQKRLPGGIQLPPEERARWRLVSHDLSSEIYARKLWSDPAALVELQVTSWRRWGTRDEHVLAMAGIGPLERELLAADA